MKIVLCIILICCVTSSYAQFYEGTYVNSVGQTLTISNLKATSFDFSVTWGLDDEWHCLFEATGNATITESTSAYFGDDPEWALIQFEKTENTISVMGGEFFVGNDCGFNSTCGNEEYINFYLN